MKILQCVLAYSIKKSSMIFAIAIISVTFSIRANVVDVTGTWKGQLASQIGLIKYTYVFQQQKEGIVAGKIISEYEGEKHEVDLTHGKLNGDSISFVESTTYNGNDLHINYIGVISADEIAFTLHVGDFATDTLIAKRQKTAQQKAAALMEHPIVLGSDDKPAFKAAPIGFDVRQENIVHGLLDTMKYHSATVGNDRKMLVYTPPNYSTRHKYPVLYLLHGIGGDEKEWFIHGHPEIILDNLYARKKIVPMIVVFPNGRAMPDDRAFGNIYDTEKVKAFENFEADLLKDIIPFIDSVYSVKPGSENRALAGLSMGGGQSLNFGLANLNTFAWIGAFSAAPNTKAPKLLVPNPDEASNKLKLLWISCGDQDGLIFISQGLHKYLKEKKVPHIWHVDSGKHEFSVWKNDLYLFSQLIFK